MIRSTAHPQRHNCSRPMKAKFPGKCCISGLRIETGSTIVWWRKYGKAALYSEYRKVPEGWTP